MTTIEAVPVKKHGLRQLNQLSKAKQFPEWTSVEHNLPENNKNDMVLCLTNSGAIRIGYLHKGEWMQGTYPATFKEIGFTVTHWMALPPLPED